ncbi:NAD(P)-binding protein [Parathielavia hyrcaniae]|uniref:NAD(P)-binding protein n=1 Tax=Parathielavia hyrcaniae TaxID=113614 RepID=A0AAN6T0B7_9PEZI|nr:NAD(P)-binding protein [Parathielavia hyrcaniae]
MSKPTVTTTSLAIPGAPFRFLHSQFTKPVHPPADLSLAGQTCILTGGNIGLGLACAEWLVELQLARLILAVRTPAKGEAAAKQLRSKGGCVARIEVWQVDMASYQSVETFAARCAGPELRRIDFVILNAGLSSMEYRRTPEGHEEVFQVNYLSTVLLAHLLLPTLREKAPAGRPGRLTIVNSGTALAAKLPRRHETPFLPTFDDKSRWAPMDQYPASKALAHFWILKLAQRVRREHVVVNLVDPGAVKDTGLIRDVKGVLSWAVKAVQWMVARTLRDGASAYLDAAVVKGPETHGCFLHDWKIHSYSRLVYGPEGWALADKIWQETMAELSFANIDAVLERM